MAARVTKKVPAKALQGVASGEINVAKDGDTVKLWTVLGGKVYELAMVAQANAPASGGSGGTTDHGNLTGLGDDDHTQYVLNTGDTIAGAVVIDGSADAIQLRVQGHSTQTNALLVLEDSAGNDQVTVSNDGAVVINEEGNDADFRVESDGDANALYVDAGANTVQVGAASASDSAKFYVSGKISVSGEAEVNGDFNHDGNNVGFYGVAPAARPSAYTQTYSTATRTHSNPTASALTDNSAGTANTTIEAMPDPADTPLTADALRDDLVANFILAVRNNIADITAQVNALIADLANAKQVLNQIIDDHQANGLLQ